MVWIWYEIHIKLDNLDYIVTRRCQIYFFPKLVIYSAFYISEWHLAKKTESPSFQKDMI